MSARDSDPISSEVCFECFPEEILCMLFRLLHWRDIISLTYASKFFANHKLVSDSGIWQLLCLEWINANKIVASITDKWDMFVQESLLVDSLKGWRWFYINFCSGYYTTRGLHLRLGKVQGKNLGGYGVYYSTYKLEVGYFASDGLSGRGLTYWWHDSSRYLGEWRQGCAHGLGTMTWTLKNYEYTGEWKEGRPIDDFASLHPRLQLCGASKECTRKVTGRTGGYAQFLYSSGPHEVCYVCKQNCHPDISDWTNFWTDGKFCSCDMHK